MLVRLEQINIVFAYDTLCFYYNIRVFLSFYFLSFPLFPLACGKKIGIGKQKFRDWKIWRKPTLKTGSSTSMMLHSFLSIFLRLFQKTSGAGALNNAKSIFSSFYPSSAEKPKTTYMHAVALKPPSSEHLTFSA